MRLIITLLLGMVFHHFAHAQATPSWQRIYNEGIRHYTAPEQLKFLPFGGRFVVLGAAAIDPIGGGTVSEKGGLWWFNAHGDTLRSTTWARPYGYAYAQGIRPFANGEVLLVGADHDSAATADRPCYVRLDSLGRRRHPRRLLAGPRSFSLKHILLPLPDESTLWIHTINLTPAGSTAPAEPLIQVARLDSAGRVIWQRRYATQSVAYAATTLLDGSYVVLGTHARAFLPGPGFDVSSGWLLRINLEGDTIGPPRFLGNISERYQPNDVQPTADGGFVVAGAVYPDAYVPTYNSSANPQAWLAKFDARGNQQWERRMAGGYTQLPNRAYAVFQQVQPLANGTYFVSGKQNTATQIRPGAYLAGVPGGSGGTAGWELRVPLISNSENYNLPCPVQPDGSVIIGGQHLVSPAIINGQSTYYTAGLLTRFTNVGTPYQPDYCALPPRADAALGLNASRDTLQLLDQSTPGPRYAQLLSWHWDFGDGTTFDGPMPPFHAYPAGMPATTAVRLTVTNSLGCVSTNVYYPFAPLGTAAQLALRARLEVFPNPAAPAQALTLRLPGLHPQPGVAGQLRNALGQVVWAGQWTVAELERGATLSPPALVPGLYLLQLSPQEASITHRLLVR